MWDRDRKDVTAKGMQMESDQKEKNVDRGNNLRRGTIWERTCGTGTERISQQKRCKWKTTGKRGQGRETADFPVVCWEGWIRIIGESWMRQSTHLTGVPAVKVAARLWFTTCLNPLFRKFRFDTHPQRLTNCLFTLYFDIFFLFVDDVESRMRS